MNRALMALTLASALAGCASSMSGVGGTESYGCKAPDGVQCTSVSGVYANTSPGLGRAGLAAAAPKQYGATSLAPGSSTASALRSHPRILRLWIAPWEDRDGDLHEESIVNVVVDGGRWRVDHVRPRPRDPFATVTPPAGQATSARPQLNEAVEPTPQPGVRHSGKDAR